MAWISTVKEIAQLFFPEEQPRAAEQAAQDAEPVSPNKVCRLHLCVNVDLHCLGMARSPCGPVTTARICLGGEPEASHVCCRAPWDHAPTFHVILQIDTPGTDTQGNAISRRGSSRHHATEQTWRGARTAAGTRRELITAPFDAALNSLRVSKK